jgi:signal transduction histidine kinase
LPLVLANEAALTQIISNLLGNAVKFVAPGVRPRVVVRGEANSGMVRLWFEDNGIGIPERLHARLFRIFSRLQRREDYEGTGIGLAIVRKAAERMNGSVGLESTEGTGSRFWVELQEAAL